MTSDIVTSVPVRLLKAVIATVRAHRALKQAAADGAREDVRVGRRKALSRALEELDVAAVAYRPPAKAPSSFDWTGAGKAVAAGLRFLQKIQGAKNGREVADVIEGEIVE